MVPTSLRLRYKAAASKCRAHVQLYLRSEIRTSENPRTSVFPPHQSVPRHCCTLQRTSDRVHWTARALFLCTTNSTEPVMSVPSFAAQTPVRSLNTVPRHCLSLLQGLYRGMAATVTGAAPYTGLKFCAYETFKISLQGFLSVEEKDLPGWMRVGAGASAGLVALTVVYPFDVIRRRMQTHRGGAKCVHLSVQCCRCNCNLHSCWHPLVGTAVHYVGVLWCVCVCMSCCHACWGCGGV